jgi:hypothetical protein
MVTSVSTTVSVDLIDVITVTLSSQQRQGSMRLSPRLATAMTDVTTIVAMIATTSMTTERGIIVTTNTITAKMMGVMTVTATMTTTVTAATAKSNLHHHHLKGATPMMRFN